MTLKEVAEFMKMNERTVLRMANAGHIPAVKIARRWRFDRYLLIDWLRANMQGISNAHLDTLGAAYEPRDTTDEFAYFAPECLQLSLKSSTKPAVLEELVAIADKAGILTDKDRFIAALRERESLLSTAVEGGIAIPHARNNTHPFFKKSALIFGRSKAGIPYDSLDGRPTHYFFMICPLNDANHLMLMARVARAIKQPDFIDQIKDTDSPDSLIALIKHRILTLNTHTERS